jgi:hypothetical protein
MHPKWLKKENVLDFNFGIITGFGVMKLLKPFHHWPRPYRKT